MQLGSRTVERMLAASFGIEDDRLLAFRGRLDHLRQRGCPRGVNTGKGKPAIFGWSQLLELAIALTLLDVGLSPDHASRCVSNNSDSICLAASNLVSRGQESGELLRAVEQQEWPFKATTFIGATAFALAGLKPGGDQGDPLIELLQAGDLRARFEGAHDVTRSIVLIDLGTKIAVLIRLVSLWSDLSMDLAIEDMQKWSDTVLDDILETVDGIDT